MTTCQPGLASSSGGPSQSKEQRGHVGTTSTKSDGRGKKGSNFKLVNGQWHKLCRGPAHEEPTWLPATDKYFYPNKTRFPSQCRLCMQWRRVKSPYPGSHHGLVPLKDARPFVIEAVNRIGLRELAKRAGVSERAVSWIVNGRVKNVRKETLRKLMLELVSIKRNNEYSISTRAAIRVVKRGANGDLCVGCGTTLDNYTEGCDQCSNRRSHRNGRLTRSEAQVT